MTVTVAGLAGEVLEIVRARVAASGLPQPGRIFIAPGVGAVWDDCCEGQLWVRVMSVTGRTGAGETNRRVGPDRRFHINAWLVRLGVGHVQCASTIDERGVAPSPAVLTAEAGLLLEYADVILKAVMCDLPVAMRPLPVEWIPAGPDGGCVGGEWTVEVEIAP